MEYLALRAVMALCMQVVQATTLTISLPRLAPSCYGQTARGKPRSQGQNTDKLLTLSANDAVGRACRLLFERDETDQSRHDYLPLNKQSQAAVQTVIATGVVVDADATPELVTQMLNKYTPVWQWTAVPPVLVTAAASERHCFVGTCSTRIMP